jgi:Uma2 family endonuclease
LNAGTFAAGTQEPPPHARLKFAAQAALLSAIRHAGLACHMLPDGMTVRIDRHTAHEPDALVYCGDRLPDSAIEVQNPVLVVEVLSPSTRHIDASAKLAGYFSVDSVRHYLIVDPDRGVVIHHQREGGERIATRIVQNGALRLDPPGMELEVESIFGAAP